MNVNVLIIRFMYFIDILVFVFFDRFWFLWVEDISKGKFK